MLLMVITIVPLLILKGVFLYGHFNVGVLKPLL